MHRPAMFFCIFLFLYLPAHAQDAKPLGTLDLDLGRLKDWGTKTYTYEASRPGSDEKDILGRVVFRTKLAAEGIILNDSMRITYKGEEYSLDVTLHCRRDNFLSPKRVESKGTGDKELNNSVATIDGTRATIRAGGRDREMTLPSSMVASWAFFRIVTLLPRQKGIRISFPHWLEEEFFVKKDFQVECLGRDTVQSGEEGIICTKFRLTGGGIHPLLYWVSDDDVLRQVLIDERKLIRLQDDQDKGE